MPKRLHITLAQINPIVGDLAYNRDKIRKIWEAPPEGTDLVVFPELAICGYPPEDLVLKPFFMRQVEKHVNALIAESKNFSAAALIPCPWIIGGKIRNAAHLAENGKILATIAKKHLPNYGVFDEQRIFSSAAAPDPVEFRGTKLGIMICEDMWETDVAAHLKKEGADILIVPNASPYDSEKTDIRMDHAAARVRETGLPMIYVNQVGGQDELVFDGGSFVLNESADVILQGDTFEEGVYDIRLEHNKGAPWMAEVKESSEKKLEGPAEIYQALMLGLRDYIGKNNFPGVLLGLSGGIDSALSAAIAVDALGPQQVRCVMMPSRFTSKDSLEDAQAQAENLGLTLDEIPIEGPVQAFHDALDTHFTANTPATTSENIQSRTRGLILMALSNATGFMVLSTGNKSEMAAGYATLYGDMCGGFNVLKDVYKTQVYELSRWRNTHKPRGGFGPEGAAIPARVLTKAPTAELRDNQTDQDTLPPYETLDDILRCLIEQDLGIEDIAKRGHDPQMIARVWRMLDAAEYKRRQAAPGIKITTRAFGRERRYPITNHFVKIVEK